MTEERAVLSVLYRGDLSSCNYRCPYCPFAMRREDRAALARDRAQVERFVTWVEALDRPVGVLFTPWGEALVRPWYQEALARLSRAPHVRRVAIQTNLSGPLRWVAEADRAALAFWATYHPGQVEREAFLAKCRTLDEVGVRYSVGVVGVREHLAEVEALRAALDPGVYLWVNAFKREPDYYTAADVAWIEAIDPLFRDNLTPHRSAGEACGAGRDAFTVDGEGVARRCHFVPTPLGNVYEQPLESLLRPRGCPNAECRCHIGYVHLDRLGLRQVYGEGLLERIPAGWSGG